MFSRFFIDRPIFASVLSLLILLLGGLAIVALPIAQYPEITPPTIRIRATYPGASAATVAQSLAAPIEQQLSGAKDLIYFSSQCTNDGQLTTTATFAIGADQDLAAVDVQNRVKLAEPKLPQEAMRQGVVVQKTSTNMLVVLSLQSTDPRFDELYLSNYATANIVDTLKRVPGAGDVICYGAKDYSMRVWLDPDKLAQKGMTVADVRNAVNEQNGLYAAGRVGQEPNAGDAQLTVPVISRGRLETPEEFAAIILRAGGDGSVVRISDVGRVELGSQSYDLFGRLDGKPGTLLIVYLQAGANALAVKEQVVATMEELARSFPAGIGYTLPYDTTKFIEVSVEEVVHTLFEAVLLVLLVVFLFLQSVRATLVPLCAVPVAIVGTFAGMMALGFTINSLTLFGLVLAIGIVVDDAIVVVENVERLMHERRLSVRDATIAAMQEVTGPVVAIVLVLSAVFVPVAFLGGITGQMYQQFAITIAVSVAISGLVALTLSPAMCVLLLKPAHGAKRGFFGLFNRCFDAATRAYTATVRGVLRGAVVAVLVFGALCFGTYKLFGALPSGFVPPEDQGYFLVAGVLPEGASLGRTSALAARVEQELLATPGVRNVLTLGGQNVLAGNATATNAFTIFAMLEPWDERKVAEKRLRSILLGFNLKWRNDPDGVVLGFNAPPVSASARASASSSSCSSAAAPTSPSWPRSATISSRGCASARRCPACRPTSASRSRRCSSTSTASARCAWACLSATSTWRCRRFCRRCTSTTSSRTAASTASTCRPSPRRAPRRRASAASRCARAAAPWCRSPASSRRAGATAPTSSRASTRIRRCRSPARRRPACRPATASAS